MVYSGHQPKSIFFIFYLFIFFTRISLLVKLLSSTYRIYTAAAVELRQSCPSLYDPIDGSPPGSSVPGILQAGIQQWVAISFSNA